MKKIIVIAFIFVNIVNAQDLKEIDITKNGISIINLETTQTSSELYKKTMSFVELNYSDFKSSIKSSLENEKIKVRSVKEKMFYNKTLFGKQYYDVSYFVEFNLETKKVTYTIENFYINKSNIPEKWNYKTFYKSDGSTLKAWVDAENILEINFSLLYKKYIDFLKN